MNFLITGRYKIIKKKPFFYLDDGWKNYFKSLKSNFKLYNPKMRKNLLLNYDCLIISGGGDIFNISQSKNDFYRDNLELKLIKLYIKKKKPIITVCRGFQLIANYYKNKLLKIREHANKNHFLIIKKNLIIKKKKIITNSYHNYGFSKLNNKFQIIGKTKDNSIEIALIKNKKTLCLMFHPERKNKNQNSINKLILNFLDLNICN